MDYAHPYFISPAFAFVGYPNRNSAPFREFYKIPEAETIMRCNLRYQGFPEFVKVLFQIGWLDTNPKDWLHDTLTWAEVTKRLVGAADAHERWVNDIFFFEDMGALIRFLYSTLVTKIQGLCASSDENEAARLVSGMRWLGLFSQDKIKPRQGNLLDTLCARLETLMSYVPGERDLVMLQHKFVVEWPDRKTVSTRSTLQRRVCNN
jgi:spermidine synthase / saccharopine dehydrogenase (NADP+, L-glutamate-forming)